MNISRVASSEKCTWAPCQISLMCYLNLLLVFWVEEILLVWCVKLCFTVTSLEFFTATVKIGRLDLNS